MLDLAVSGEVRFGQSPECSQNYQVLVYYQSGKAAEVVSVWIILEDEDIPRFVTDIQSLFFAHPYPVRSKLVQVSKMRPEVSPPMV